MAHTGSRATVVGWQGQGAARGSPERSPQGVESNSSTKKGAASHKTSDKMRSGAKRRGLPRGCFPERFSHMSNDNAIIAIPRPSSGE